MRVSVEILVLLEDVPWILLVAKDVSGRTSILRDDMT